MSTTTVKPAPKNRSRYKNGKRVKRAASARSGRGFWVVIAVVVVIGVAAVVAVASGSKPKAASSAASAALLSKVTSVPKAVFDQVGSGTASASTPKAITAPALTADGKPRIVYLGAEYCPYCATERWPMVIALSRFGTFTGLKTTSSSRVDVFPSTQTFSFHGAQYTSKWLSFSGVEMQTNQQQGDGYAPLDQPTAEEQALLDQYDKAPYVGTSSSSGGIPFIDFGGKFLVSGATYDASVLQGKSRDDIAAALSDPTSAISKGAIGVANTFTAAICSMTNNQPSAVCSDPVIQHIQTTLY